VGPVVEQTCQVDSATGGSPAGYGPDLAGVHHGWFGDFARHAAGMLLGELRRAHPGGLVVDLGCGSGILAKALTEAGYDVLGVDLSADMIRLASAHAPAATFVRASLFDVELPACVAVTAIGECLNYAFDARSGLGELARLFGRIHAALQQQGVLLFDVAGPGRAGPGRAQQTFRDHPDWSLYFEAVEDDAGQTLTRQITVFQRVGELYRRSDERHLLRLYRGDDIAELLDGAGFRVRRLDAYGALRFGPGWAGFLAIKAGEPG